MKIIVGLITLALLFTACGGAGTPGSFLSSSVSAEETATETVTFKVDGMTCAGCEVAVRQVVKKLEGIEDVKASHKQGEAEVTYDPESATLEQIEAAIETLGYQAEVQVAEKAFE